MHSFEAEFKAQLDALDSDSRTAATFAYTDFTLNHIAGGDTEILDRLNLHPAFWNTVIGGLQAAAFVALGRIYDDDRQNYNAGQLLKYAEDHPGIFSAAALEARKVRDGLSQADAKTYATGAFVPQKGSLAGLRAEFAGRQATYKAKIAPIRHKVFAHRAKIDSGERDRLFSNLMLRDLEDVVVFPLRLSRALFDLLENGR